MCAKSRCVAMLLVSLVAPAYALNLTEAYQAALAQDASLQAMRSATDAGHEAVPQARAQLLPTINASFSRNNNELLSRSPNFLGQETETSYGYPSRNDTLSLRQPIFRWYQWSLYRQAQTQVDEVDASLSGELQNLAVRVSNAYFEILLAEDQLGLIRKQLAVYRAHVDAAQKTYAAGAGIRTDVDEAQSRLDMSLAQELEALQNVEFTRQKLRVIINQPVDQLAALNTSAMPLRRPDPDQLEAWIERAQRASPEVKMQTARLESARLEIEKARAGHLPTLDAVAQWTRSSSENSLSVNSSYEQHSVGLQLTIPIFSGGGVSSSMRQAVANKERAEHNLEATQRDLGVRVHKEFRSVTEGIVRIKALEQAVNSSEQVLLSSQKSFQAGSRTRLDVLNAEARRAVALQDLSQARYLFLLSQLRLRALVGEANLETIQTLNQVLLF